MFKRQKVPARKKKLCFKFAYPHVAHITEGEADKEQQRLSNKFKGSEFEVFICPFCKKFHVGKVPANDNDDEY